MHWSFGPLFLGNRRFLFFFDVAIQKGIRQLCGFSINKKWQKSIAATLDVNEPYPQFPVLPRLAPFWRRIYQLGSQCFSLRFEQSQLLMQAAWPVIWYVKAASSTCTGFSYIFSKRKEWLGDWEWAKGRDRELVASEEFGRTFHFRADDWGRGRCQCSPTLWSIIWPSRLTERGSLICPIPSTVCTPESLTNIARAVSNVYC